ncbi:putative phosphatase SPAC5H10.03 [Lachnellula cervina]|uniref:Putative phosphatase SPAC5H10.03 n=1 Tax=Lachnellula cervina TaxID=1316786 RepID=A0A7D8YNC8_9HELO|nr:putative phosphatase SPAC5H10.03 [Lachnellula cervina]
MSTIHILRHGQSLHNIERGYPHRDPPLTELGCQQARNLTLSTEPDLILISPMTRTIQTALLALGPLIDRVKVQICSELREAHDAVCNTGVDRADLTAKFPQFDFSGCSETWDYPPHSVEHATLRAQGLRQHLNVLSNSYKNILLVTHRGFIAYLVKGPRYDLCESRSYKFASKDEIATKRYGIHIDTGLEQDFGPTLLLQNNFADLVDSGDQTSTKSQQTGGSKAHHVTEECALEH